MYIIIVSIELKPVDIKTVLVSCGRMIEDWDPSTRLQFTPDLKKEIVTVVNPLCLSFKN